MILDTNAVSALFAGNSTIEAVLSNSLKHHLPAIVLGEYRFGIRRSSRKRKLTSLLDTLEQESYILTVDATTARHYAETRFALKGAGTPIPENDLWIVALAQQYELEIVSQDKHFDIVKNIKRISW